eukprot:454231_1
MPSRRSHKHRKSRHHHRSLSSDSSYGRRQRRRRSRSSSNSRSRSSSRSYSRSRARRLPYNNSRRHSRRRHSRRPRSSSRDRHRQRRRQSDHRRRKRSPSGSSRPTTSSNSSLKCSPNFFSSGSHSPSPRRSNGRDFKSKTDFKSTSKTKSTKSPNKSKSFESPEEGEAEISPPVSPKLKINLPNGSAGGTSNEAVPPPNEAVPPSNAAVPPSEIEALTKDKFPVSPKNIADAPKPIKHPKVSIVVKSAKLQNVSALNDSEIASRAHISRKRDRWDDGGSAKKSLKEDVPKKRKRWGEKRVSSAVPPTDVKTDKQEAPVPIIHEDAGYDSSSSMSISSGSDQEEEEYIQPSISSAGAISSAGSLSSRVASQSVLHPFMFPMGVGQFGSPSSPPLGFPPVQFQQIPFTSGQPPILPAAGPPPRTAAGPPPRTTADPPPRTTVGPPPRTAPGPHSRTNSFGIPGNNISGPGNLRGNDSGPGTLQRHNSGTLQRYNSESLQRHHSESLQRHNSESLQRHNSGSLHGNNSESLHQNTMSSGVLPRTSPSQYDHNIISASTYQGMAPDSSRFSAGKVSKVSPDRLPSPRAVEFQPSEIVPENAMPNGIKFSQAHEGNTSHQIQNSPSYFNKSLTAGNALHGEMPTSSPLRHGTPPRGSPQRSGRHARRHSQTPTLSYAKKSSPAKSRRPPKSFKPKFPQMALGEAERQEEYAGEELAKDDRWVEIIKLERRILKSEAEMFTQRQNTFRCSQRAEHTRADLVDTRRRLHVFDVKIAFLEDAIEGRKEGTTPTAVHAYKTAGEPRSSSELGYQATQDVDSNESFRYIAETDQSP